MNEISQLIKTLKRRLKIQGMTYRELAAALNLSEASVKRLFASERFTLERIVEIANLLGFTLAELAAEAAVSENRLHTLNEEQEKELVSDIKLLLVAVCVLNQWPVDTIVETFQISRPECIQRLVKLDRLRLRGPCGARDEFLLAATAQNLRKMAKLMPAGAPPLAA